jgi:peptidoglycan/LPS O-acetylase OafA/YrhL
MRAKPGEIPALDGVRGLAILLVVLCHASSAQHWPGPPPLQVLEGFAYVGVDLFFVLSGFLIFAPYARAILNTTPLPSARGFYARRARRILPAFAVAAVPLATVLFVAGLSGASGALLTLGSLATFTFDMRSESWHMVSHYPSPLWSLAVECQFYLILPWLALILSRLRRRWLVPALLVSAGIGLIVRGAAAALHYSWGWPAPVVPLLYGAKGKYWECFALGMLTAVVYQRGILARRPHIASALLGFALIGLASSLIWSNGAGRLLDGNAFLFPVSATQWPWSVFGDFTICACFSALVLAVLHLPALTIVFSVRWLRFAGRISYSVYLWHQAILEFLLSPGMAPTIQTALRFIGAFALIICVGWLSYRFIERPFLSQSTRRPPAEAPRLLLDGSGR